MTDNNLSSLLMRFMNAGYVLTDNCLSESEKYLFGDTFINEPRVDKKLSKVLKYIKSVMRGNRISNLEGLYAYYDKKHEMLNQFIKELEEQDLADTIKAALPKFKDEPGLKKLQEEYNALRTPLPLSTPNPLTRIEPKKKKYKGYISPIGFLRFVTDNYTFSPGGNEWVDKSGRRAITEEQMLENYKMTL